MNNAVWLVAVGLVTTAGQVAYATQYLTQADAQKVIFAEATEFKPVLISLNAAQKTAVSSVSKTSTPIPDKTIWQAYAGGKHVGWFVIDEVYGKHEYITYAVGIDLNGAVRRVEVLEYRETYGGQVRNATWRDQFVGKKNGAKLKLEDDIANISGATLSCLHISDGVRRVLALHEFVLKKIA